MGEEQGRPFLWEFHNIGRLRERGKEEILPKWHLNIQV